MASVGGALSSDVGAQSCRPAHPSCPLCFPSSRAVQPILPASWPTPPVRGAEPRTVTHAAGL